MDKFNPYRYQLDFLVHKTGISAEYLKDMIAEFGQDLDIQQEQDSVRVRIRTDDPELVLDLCGQVGKLDKIKVDELREDKC
jgi:dihydroxyacetone kinase-like predicted kinase